MRKLFIVVPQFGIQSGGLITQLRLQELATQVYPTELVTYYRREPNVAFLDDVLPSCKSDNAIFLIHWGTDADRLLTRLREHNVVYHAYSTGFGFSVNPRVPILAGSRPTMGYWGHHAPNSPIFLLPCVIASEYCDAGVDRDIDVLVQRRKSSQYLLEKLVPALRSHCKVTVLDDWVEELPTVLQRSKVYLYDSSEHSERVGLTEGFGLPPLEAIACGCTVFSSVNDGLSDFIDPPFNAHKLRVYSLDYDRDRIVRHVRKWTRRDGSGADPVAAYRPVAIQARFTNILSELNEFFDHCASHQPTIDDYRDSIRRERRFRLLRRFVPAWIKKRWRQYRQ